MRIHRILMILLASAFSFHASAQYVSNYPGDWEGLLDVGVKLRIVFHIRMTDDHALKATADSPDQSAFGMKCDTAFVSDNGIIIEMRNLRASFKGKLIDDSKITGTFTQGKDFPLELKRSKGPLAIHSKPQEPKGPFPYNVYEVEYDNADRSVHFGATLTVPKPEPGVEYIKAPEYPVAILITGSGTQDRDETLFEHKPFWVIADHLTRNGFAVLRVDDRGAGKTKGGTMFPTSADFVNDVEAGIEFLKTRPDINKNKIGLIGHSEGGMIAPMVAMRRSDIDFMILLAGPGIPNSTLMVEQNQAIVGSKVPKTALKDYMILYKSVLDIVRKAPDTATARKKATAYSLNWGLKTPQKTRDILGFQDETSLREFAKSLTDEFSLPWFHFFLNYDPQPALRATKSKVLALNGSKDVQVISKSNLAGIRLSLQKSKSPYFEIKELPGLNHLFQHCKDCTVNEYGSLEETFSPDALQIMTDWLNKHVGR